MWTFSIGFSVGRPRSDISICLNSRGTESIVVPKEIKRKDYICIYPMHIAKKEEKGVAMEKDMHRRVYIVKAAKNISS